MRKFCKINATKLIIVTILIICTIAIGTNYYFKKSRTPIREHGHIEKVFSDIYYVMGSHKYTHDGVEFQHSGTMTIVRNGNDLTLINTIKLTPEGLNELDALGNVKNVVRIGAFHGAYDAFYIDRYHAKFWALNGMKNKQGKQIDVALTPGGTMPFPHSTLITFQTSKHAEAMIYIGTNDGILVTCDSIKNWIEADEYFSPETAKLYTQQGQLGMASIDATWLNACDVKKSDFDKLQLFSFKHLISSHGKPLLHNAHDSIKRTLEHVFKSKSS